MEKFIHDENLLLYKRVLSQTTDAAKRKQLIEMIRVELAKEQMPKG